MNRKHDTGSGTEQPNTGADPAHLQTRLKRFPGKLQ
jgi:hypothetical protein